MDLWTAVSMANQGGKSVIVHQAHHSVSEVEQTQSWPNCMLHQEVRNPAGHRSCTSLDGVSCMIVWFVKGWVTLVALQAAAVCVALLPALAWVCPRTSVSPVSKISRSFIKHDSSQSQSVCCLDWT